MGELSINSDIRLRGKIRVTSPFPGGLQAPDVDRIDFGGIENEGRFVGAGGMASAAAMNLTDGYPRLTLPDNVDTSVFVMMQIDEWWLKDRLGIQFEFINDAAGAGNVRFEYNVKEVDIFVDTPANAAVIVNHQQTHASGGAGTTSTVAIRHPDIPQGSMPFTPGIFGNCYPLRITRLGAGGPGNGDTLVGDIGIVAASWFTTET